MQTPTFFGSLCIIYQWFAQSIMAIKTHDYDNHERQTNCKRIEIMKGVKKSIAGVNTTPWHSEESVATRQTLAAQ